MTKAELKLLNDEELFRFFTENAGYRPDAPADVRYSIRFGSSGSSVLFDSETHLLRDKFFNVIRKG